MKVDEPAGVEQSGLAAEDADLDETRSVRRTRTLTRAFFNYKVKYGVHSIQNLRPEMEDAHCARLGLGLSEEAEITIKPGSAMPLAPTSGVSDPAKTGSAMEEPALGSFSYFAVFDGHGGARAAEFSNERLGNLLAADQEALRKDPTGALRDAFARLEGDWHDLALENEYMDGTTAAVALVDRSADRCIVGNVGDSEVLLGTRDKNGKTEFRPLTEVHHLKRSESEAARIQACGGRLWRGRLGHPKINPLVCSLAVSRSIGDIYFKAERYTDGRQSGLTAEPFIASVDLCGKDVAEQFLLIGCDGLWDSVTYQDAADFVFARLEQGEEPQAISEALVQLASDAGSSDNITVMVVSLVV